MNIYDEAIKQVKRDTYNKDGNHEYHKTIRTLEYAKKEHELLDLYRKLNQHSPLEPCYYDIQAEIRLFEEELYGRKENVHTKDNE